VATIQYGLTVRACKVGGVLRLQRLPSGRVPRRVFASRVGIVIATGKDKHGKSDNSLLARNAGVYDRSLVMCGANRSRPDSASEVVRHS
jgi:hypothetical protein